MDATETIRLLDLCTTAWPNMRLEPNTPDLWATLLRDVPLEDAIAAVRRLMERSTFAPQVTVILQEVRQVQRARLSRPLPAPNVDPADTGAWLREQRALVAAVAAGSVDPAEYERSGRVLSARPAVESTRDRVVVG